MMEKPIMAPVRPRWGLHLPELHRPLAGIGRVLPAALALRLGSIRFSPGGMASDCIRCIWGILQRSPRKGRRAIWPNLMMHNRRRLSENQWDSKLQGFELVNCKNEAAGGSVVFVVCCVGDFQRKVCTIDRCRDFSLEYIGGKKLKNLESSPAVAFERQGIFMPSTLPIAQACYLSLDQKLSIRNILLRRSYD